MGRLEQTGKKYIIDGKKIEARKKTNNKWFETQDSINYWDDFSRPKIVWIELVDRPNFALDETGIMINNTVFFITGNNIHFLLAYLNSTLCDWHFGKICATSGAGTRRWIKQYIEQIYAPIPNEKQNQDMKILIEKIDKASENLKMKLISEIDDKIFSLFNLSIEEKNFIKNSIP